MPLRNSIKIFELLERYEVDILPGNGIPLLRAVSGKKDKVVDCIQKGYSLNDKVIRFAKVIVAK